MSKGLDVNLKEAMTFLQSYDEELRITFQVYDDTKKGGRAEHFTANFDDEKCQEYLTRANNSGLGIYFMMNAGDGNGRSNNNVTHLRALVADLDGAPLEPVLQCELEPHFIVESSKGRYQCHWLIDPVSIDSFEGGRDEAKHRFAALQVAIARKFHGDESVKDLCRVFRIPGFYHQKAAPFLSRIIEHNPGLPYPLDKVIETLGLSTTIEKVKSELKEPLGEVDMLLSNKIKAGARHRTLLAYASKYAHQFRLGFNERRWLLEGLNRNACESPIDSADLERINIQAGRYAEDERARVETVDISALLEKHKIVSENQNDLLPQYLLNPPGLVGDVMNYILASSIKPQPELALAAALVACGTVMGRKVRTQTNLRTNVYCLSLIETGGGKDWPRQAIKRIFDGVGKPQRAAIEDVASDAAISEILIQTPAQAFLLDEFGRFMKNVTSKNAGSHLIAIPTLLMKLYSSAGGPFYTKAYADTKQNKVIYQPNVCLLATSVERNFYNSITKESVDDGLLNRILFFRSTEPDPQIRKVENFDPPESLIAQFKAWEDLPYRYSGGNLDQLESSESVKPQPRIIPFAEGAEAIFSDMESDLRNYRKELRREGLSGLFTRVYENAQKVALILACGRNIEAPQISIGDAEYACDLVTTLTKTLLRAVKRNVSDNRVEASHKVILNLIRDAGPEGMTKKALGQRAKDFGLNRRERDEILKDLMEWNQVLQQEAPGTTRPTTKFFFLSDEREKVGAR